MIKAGGFAVALAQNLKRLMEAHGLTQAALARKTGVSQRTVSSLLDVDEPANPRASTVDQVAAFFGVPAWQLFVPDMPLELLQSRQLEKVVENYRDAPPDGRSNIARIAESEVRYAVLHDSGKDLDEKAS